MKLQNFRNGEIHRVNSKYQFVVKGKVTSTHDSVQELVNAHKPKAKKQGTEKNILDTDQA